MYPQMPTDAEIEAAKDEIRQKAAASKFCVEQQAIAEDYDALLDAIVGGAPTVSERVIHAVLASMGKSFERFEIDLHERRLEHVRADLYARAER